MSSNANTQEELFEEGEVRATGESAIPGKTLLKLLKIVWWCRTHPAGAAFLLLGILLRAPHQSITIRKMWTISTIAMKLSRGMSKSFLLGLYSILKTLLWSGNTGAVLGAGARTGLLIFEETIEPMIDGTLDGQEAREFARRSLRDERRIVQNDRHRTMVCFGKRHRSLIVTGPLGRKGANSPLRGLRTNAFLAGDEFAEVDEDVWEPVVKPFGNVAKGFGRESTLKELDINSLYAGTIRYDWQYYTRIVDDIELQFAAGSKNHLVVEFNYEDAFYYAGNDKERGPIVFVYPIRKQKIEDEQRLADRAYWLAENKNQVIAQADSEYPSQLIQKIRNHELDGQEGADRFLKPMLACPDPCVVGIDPARESDAFALTVVRLGLLATTGPVYPFNHIIYSQILQQRPFQEMADLIWDIDERFNVVAFMVDHGGGGVAVRDLLTYPAPGISRAPIYDPEDFDEENPIPLSLEAEGKPILHLVKCNNERLTTWNNFLKGQMEQNRFLFPQHEAKDPSAVMNRVYRTIYEQGRQFTYIMSKPAGRFKSYVAPNRRYKKDLYSATVMAAVHLYEMTLKDQRGGEEEPLNMFSVIRAR